MCSKGVMLGGSVLGLVSSFLGLFLPWSKEGGWGNQNFLGYEFLLGNFLLIGCIIATMSWGFHLRRQTEKSLKTTLIGELIVLSASLVWIVNPLILPWHWLEAPVVGYGRVLGYLGMEKYFLYGACTSLIGSIIVVVIIIFEFLHR
jgi:hypothetical protein